MKLLLVGSDWKYAIENYYFRHMKESGVDIHRFNASTLFSNYYQGIVSKLLFSAGLSPIYRTINKQFKAAVNQTNPDVIWVFKGMEIFPGSLEWAKAKGIKLVNFNPDSPIVFTGKGSGNKNVTNSIGLFDLHLTYSLSIKKQLEENFHKRVAYLPFGFEISGQLYQECLQEKEILKACFIGNPDPERASFLTQLAELGIRLDIYGYGWKKYVRHPNLEIYDAVLGKDFWKALRQYRVQLNLMRLHNPDSHNMRTFEVPAIGGIAALPDTKEHRAFFQEGSEAFFYHSAAGCSELIQKLLSMPADDANQIRHQARARSLQSGYSYEERTRTALEAIGKLF